MPNECQSAEQAFILIQTEDGCYIFSADKDEKTSEVYQQLKDDL